VAVCQCLEVKGLYKIYVEIHMAKGYVPDAKIYPSQSHGKLSILDMLRNFEEKAQCGFLICI